MPAAREWGRHDDYAMINVSWQDVTHTAWAQAMIPTESQWEKAAGAMDRRTWPWEKPEYRSIVIMRKTVSAQKQSDCLITMELSIVGI